MLEADKRGGDWCRVEPRARADSSVALYEWLAGATSTPSARNEAFAVMSRAIESLPDADRQVVEIYDLDGQPVEELTAALHPQRRGRLHAAGPRPPAPERDHGHGVEVREPAPLITGSRNPSVRHRGGSNP